MKKPSKLMILFVLVLAGFIVPPSFSQTEPAAKPALRNERIVGRALYDKLRKEGRTLVKLDGLANLNWTPDGKAYFVFEDGTFKRVDLATGEKSPLFDDAKLLAAVNGVTGRQEAKLFFNSFQFLDNGKKVQFSGFNKVFIYDPASGKLFSYEPERTLTGVRGRGYGDSLSPDLKYRAFTRSYNLYIKDMDGNETALTADGTEDLRNGFPDWVYPEELGQYQAFWWAPDSKKIAFMQFDESPVAKYPIVHDVAPMPRYELQGYPVPGANNPVVRLFIVDIATKKLVRLETGDDLDVYLYRGQWTNDGREFTYHRLNRLQNRVEVFAADPVTGKIRLVLKDEDPCYIDEQTDLDFLKDNQRFLWTSERSGWREIYLYGLDGRLLKQLTSARLPVQSVLGIDEAGGWVYFVGAEKNGTESHLYKVKLDGTGFTKMTKEPGLHMVSFAPGFAYYTDTFSNFDQPMKSTLCQADGKEVKVIGQAVPGKEFQALKLIKPEHFLFKSADGKYDLDGLVYFPAHFNPKEKYPIVVALSGGHDSTALAFLLKEQNPERSYNYVCTPTGNELPEMFEHWVNLGERLGRRLVPIMAGTLHGIIREEKMLPNFRARFCTRRLKIEPYRKFLIEQAALGPIVSYVGLRADEEGRAGGAYSDIAGIEMRFPLREWMMGEDEVQATLRRFEVVCPDRTDCGDCYHQRLGEWYEYWLNHRARAMKAVALEAEMGATFRTPGRDGWPTDLKSLFAMFEADLIPTTSLNRMARERMASGSCRVCSL